MKTPKTQVGRRIARLRKAAGLTQAELAELTGVQPVTIGRIEVGMREASLDLVFRVSKALSIEVHEFFRMHEGRTAREDVFDRFLLYGSRLSTPELELSLQLLSSVLVFARRLEARRPVAVEKRRAPGRGPERAAG